MKVQKHQPAYIHLTRTTLEPEPKANGSPMAHPFIVETVVIKDKKGKIMKHVNPRKWPEYGLEKP